MSLVQAGPFTWSCKWLLFSDEGVIVGRKTRRYSVHNKTGTHLGDVVWESWWRQYVFKPCDATFYSSGCVADISEFLKMVTDKQKDKEV